MNIKNADEKAQDNTDAEYATDQAMKFQALFHSILKEVRDDHNLSAEAARTSGIFGAVAIIDQLIKLESRFNKVSIHAAEGRIMYDIDRALRAVREKDLKKE